MLPMRVPRAPYLGIVVHNKLVSVEALNGTKLLGGLSVGGSVTAWRTRRETRASSTRRRSTRGARAQKLTDEIALSVAHPPPPPAFVSLIVHEGIFQVKARGTKRAAENGRQRLPA